MQALQGRCVMVSLLCGAAALPGAALAQTNPLSATRLELRIVPQTGQPGGAGGVVDIDETSHTPVLLADADRTRRFEVQYRVVQLAVAVEFAGLQLAVFDIDASTSGGTTGVTLGRALLSRDEAGNAGAGGVNVPPGPVDTSPASASGARGLHRPFRGIIPAPPPNNDYSANGVLRPGGLKIDDVTPVTISASGQSEQDAQGNLRWYGVYSFEATFGLGGTDPDGDGFVNVGLDATLYVSTSDGNVWFGFVADDPQGHPSALHTNAHASVRVQVPGTGSGLVATVGGVILAGRRRRGRAIA